MNKPENNRSNRAVCLNQYHLLYILTGAVTLLPLCRIFVSGNGALSVELLYTAALQIGTLLTSGLLFNRVFPPAKNEWSACIGTLLYMTCPYRIQACYGASDPGRTLAWMLLPLYLWAVLGILSGVRQLSTQGGALGSLPAGMRKFQYFALASLVLAGIGYADPVFFITVAGLTLPAAIYARNRQCFLLPFAGCALFLPGLYRLALYLFTDRYDGLQLPLGPIMQDGYRLGEYLHAYISRHDNPGMGIGMLLCLLTCIWLQFVADQEESPDRETLRMHKLSVFFTIMGIFLTALSSCYFPWDVFQRPGRWALKLISMIETPTVFWGMAYLCLCVPAARAVQQLESRVDSRTARTVRLLVISFCIGTTAFMLTRFL
ncbi:MAG: hypothetical protein NC398_06135 [Acetatifactor muris]|nr:hypothetical protein [Acetatifactor muris]MCM1526672.1 hypothetical protein [Bacteroides sp.]